MSVSKFESQHEENRKKLCAPCGEKIVLGVRKSNYYSITDRQENLIKAYVNNNYCKSNSRFPTSICNTCKVTLYEREKNVEKRPMPIMPKHENFNLLRQLRFNPRNCNCLICLKASYKGHITKIKGRGNTKVFRDFVAQNPYKSHGRVTNGKYSCKKKGGVLNNSKSRINKKVNCCPDCLQVIGKGINHSCNIKKQIEYIVENKLNKKQQGQLISKILRRKAEENLKNNNTIKSNTEIEISTEGKKMRVVLNPQNKKSVEFSCKSLQNFQVNTGSTLNDMKKVTNYLR